MARLGMGWEQGLHDVEGLSDDDFYDDRARDEWRSAMAHIQLARLKSHEKHMGYIYGLRWGGLGLAGLTILCGAVMVFLGLQGSFDWAIQAPSSVGAKLTNASPGIVFATVGMIVGMLVVIQRPVNYSTGPETRQQRAEPSRRERPSQADATIEAPSAYRRMRAGHIGISDPDD